MSFSPHIVAQNDTDTQPRLVERTIFVKGLCLDLMIGIYDFEHKAKQPLMIDVELDIGIHPIRSLDDTFNYEEVRRAAQAIAARGHVDLVETFVEDLAHSLFTDPRISRVKIRAAKPKALEQTQGAGCEMVFVR